MDFGRRTIHLRIRRYDLSDSPDVIKKSVEFPFHLDCSSLKLEVQKLCGINDEKVMKIRNRDGMLVPISFLIEINDNYFYIDITNISYVDKKAATLLQDAYVDAVRQKIRTLESRIAQSELLLPQLEWRRQAYTEDT
ncbi:hypothetical protein NQ317_016002, partial [Molorchus minor]